MVFQTRFIVVIECVFDFKKLTVSEIDVHLFQLGHAPFYNVIIHDDEIVNIV